MDSPVVLIVAAIFGAGGFAGAWLSYLAQGRKLSMDERRALNAEWNALRAEVKADLAECRTNNDRLESELIQTRHDLTATTDELDRVRRQLGATEGRVLDLEATKARLEGQVVTLRRQMAEYQGARDAEARTRQDDAGSATGPLPS